MKYTLQQIKDWRYAEHQAGRPSRLVDFYAAHNIPHCKRCGTRRDTWEQVWRHSAKCLVPNKALSDLEH